MIINSQGFGHFTRGINNQDFAIETSRMLMVLDGCSSAKYSEVGTRLFAQLFSRKEECDNLDKFEDNVKNVFDDILEMMMRYYPIREELEKNFIMENLLFTIIAVFQTEEEYIVKLFGDGYIVTQNNVGQISYMKFNYGDAPPYFAYKYCKIEGYDFSAHSFKTLSFNKKVFPNIAIATDGIMPIAKGDVKEIDKYLFEGNKVKIQMKINEQRQEFVDDITIGTFGGEK